MNYKGIYELTDIMDVIGLDNNPVNAATQNAADQINNEKTTHLQQIERVKDSRRFLYRQPVYPDDLPDDSPEYLEGKKKLVSVNTYERNLSARRACIEEHGTVCSICKFDFAKIYGAEFEGMIHVHHLKKISEADGEYILDPRKDLVPVCPNCHMVLHSKSDVYAIDEVKAMLGL